MPKKLPTAKYFEIIKENHRKYLEENMVTHLELTGDLKQAKLVDEYTKKIGSYHGKKQRYLNRAIEQASLATKVGHGALAALFGVGAGGLAFYAQKSSSITDAINPLAGVQNTAAGLFSAVIGVGVSYLAYNAFEKWTEKPAEADEKMFKEAMEKAGFTNKKYEKLSEEIVKLFHFRECLLLGLKDTAGMNMREEFKEKYAPDSEPYNEEALNAAIEVYFLAQLNELFNNAFKEIYAIHDEEIEEDSAQYRVVRWLRSFFENKEKRQEFSQQLQLRFMEQCLNYLEAQMAEPSFFAKYPYATASMSGLIAGAIALGLAAAIIGGPITLGILSIGLVIACVTAVATYWAVNNIDSLHFKRSKENRTAIQQAIDDVTKESERLERLIQDVVHTTPEDVERLAEYKKEGVPEGFLSYFNIFSQGKKQVAMGANTAWIREHASRYRHSKFVEIDLSEQHTGIIDNGLRQTEEMQAQLKDAVHNKKAPKLQHFIEHTQEYLRTPEHRDFIQRFKLVEKIKQQVLEIVAALPEEDKESPLPEELIAFYTAPIAEGGLGGLKQDLEQVRALAPITDAPANKFHPYNKILVTAQRFNYALTQAENRDFILRGDDGYRDMLGLSVTSPSERIENKINAGNIKQYLNHSFDFLYSLNRSVQTYESSKLDEPFENSMEFILYRTLLIKQLASLYDPNNLRVDDLVRREIETFAREKLHIDPKVVFDNVMQQALFIERDKSGPSIEDPLGVKRPLSDLEYIADAIRVDLAYASKAVTPRMMIAPEAKDFLIKKADTERTMFSYENSKAQLTPEPTPEYVEKIRQTIATTKEFLKAMGERNTLKQTGALACYIYDCHNEIMALRQQIVKCDEAVPKKTTEKDEVLKSKELAAADKLLEDYQLELKQLLSIKTVEESQLMQSTIHFGKFKTPQPDLLTFSITDLEFREMIEPKAQTSESPRVINEDLSTSTLMRSIIFIEPKPPEINKENLGKFIKDMEGYLTQLKEEPEISRFNFYSFSNSDKIKAAEALKKALEHLSKDEAVDDTAFLKNPIYNDPKLKNLISINLVSMGVDDLHELFASAKKLEI
ncbi:Uncharacterised protein [Legionella lansingensis]|uniref:Uncharacterized protein n=1 Tax=Legionella lansingensis TaxID=45067 RepID=A0A0W0VPD2_9GAMM|nr:hypothetical protein [Legionella lansingensis]KTD22001.1 hypothetical protein Llan_1264 [Legionella lansingensis]SNV53925.1 Uncharacterised protein [Legionella lansingensis]